MTESEFGKLNIKEKREKLASSFIQIIICSSNFFHILERKRGGFLGALFALFILGVMYFWYTFLILINKLRIRK